MSEYRWGYKCWLGYPTDRNPEDTLLWTPEACSCDDACEPHIHENEYDILCLHDGENDHGHCPNAVTSL